MKVTGREGRGGNFFSECERSVDTNVRRGDIYYADLSPVVGSEQGGVRPVLIIQNDTGNRYSPTVIAAAITVGLYPDLPREKFIILGNSSLAGAKRLLLDASCRARLDRIREMASYVQFGEMEKFVENMQAARFLPHTDASRYPSVMRRLRERGKVSPPGKLAAERSGAD